MVYFGLLFAFVAACQNESSPTPPHELIIASDSIDVSGMNLYCSSDNLQFALDSNAKISLYVQAERNDDGDFLFDDGQDWLLLFETAFGDYPLFPRKFIQLGRIEYSAFNGYSGEKYDSFHVLVTVRQSAGHKIYDCVFDADKKAFEIVPVYNAENINPVGSSLE
jgi:hypothetical protein